MLGCEVPADELSAMGAGKVLMKGMRSVPSVGGTQGICLVFCGLATGKLLAADKQVASRQTARPCLLCARRVEKTAQASIAAVLTLQRFTEPPGPYQPA